MSVPEGQLLFLTSHPRLGACPHLPEPPPGPAVSFSDMFPSQPTELGTWNPTTRARPFVLRPFCIHCMETSRFLPRPEHTGTQGCLQTCSTVLRLQASPAITPLEPHTGQTPPKKLGWLLQMWTPGKQSLEMSSPLKQRHVGPGLSSPSCLWAAAPRLIGPVLMLTPGRTSREADPGTGGLTALV